MGYYETSPSRPQDYPDSIKESKLVLQQMKKPDLNYFEMTDENLLLPFQIYLDNKGLDYSESELKDIIRDSLPIIIAHKNFYNRPRPKQVNPEIKAPDSKSANTPSYPAGHTFQSQLVAKHLSAKYPKHTRQFYDISNRISQSRISMGLHYPSDVKKAKQLAQIV